MTTPTPPTPTPPPTVATVAPPATVEIRWTVPPFGVVFGVVWRVGLAILACYGVAFAAVAFAIAMIAGS